jgi:hypothetical protein
LSKTFDFKISDREIENCHVPFVRFHFKYS